MLTGPSWALEGIVLTIDVPGPRWREFQPRPRSWQREKGVAGVMEGPGESPPGRGFEGAGAPRQPQRIILGRLAPRHYAVRRRPRCPRLARRGVAPHERGREWRESMRRPGRCSEQNRRIACDCRRLQPRPGPSHHGLTEQFRGSALHLFLIRLRGEQYGYGPPRPAASRLSISFWRVGAMGASGWCCRNWSR